MTFQAGFQFRRDDGHRWHKDKRLAMLVRLASRGEAHCGVYVEPGKTCLEPAAVISEIGDCYCAKHFGYKATDRLRADAAGVTR